MPSSTCKQKIVRVFFQKRAIELQTAVERRLSISCGRTPRIGCHTLQVTNHRALMWPVRIRRELTFLLNLVKDWVFHLAATLSMAPCCHYCKERRCCPLFYAPLRLALCSAGDCPMGGCHSLPSRNMRAREITSRYFRGSDLCGLVA